MTVYYSFRLNIFRDSSLLAISWWLLRDEGSGFNIYGCPELQDVGV